MNTSDHPVSPPRKSRSLQEAFPTAAALTAWAAGLRHDLERARATAPPDGDGDDSPQKETPAPQYRLRVLRPGGEPPAARISTCAADTTVPSTVCACTTGDGRFLATWLRTGAHLRLGLCAGVADLAFARVAFHLHGRECQVDLHDGRAELLLEAGTAPAPALSGFSVLEEFALTEISGPTPCGEGSILGMAALMEPHGAVCCTALLADGRLRLLTGGRTEEFTPEEFPPLALASATARQALTASGGCISLTPLAPTAPALKLGALPNATCLAWCRSAHVVAAANTAGRIELWHALTGQHLRTVEAGAPVRSIALSPDGTSLAAALDDALLLAGPAATIRVPLPAPATALAYSPASPLLTAALHDGSLVFLHPATGHLLHRTGAAPAPARPAALACDARHELHLATQQ